MNLRQKLVGLLNMCVDDNIEIEGGFVSYGVNYANMADYLIAHDVTVQEHGSWIDSCEYACLHKCSACGGNAPEDLESGLDTKTNYCPHCGAKMMPQPPKGE